MLAVLLSWIFSYVVFTAIGCLLQKILWKRPPENWFFLLLNGMFLYMLIVWSLLFFTGFGLGFQMGFFILSLLILGRWKKDCLVIKALKQQAKSLATYQKILLPVLFVLLLFLSGAGSNLPDNYTYYIQTIKWANEQGFVKGLMNLHPFLGQFSGWHILQAGVNLPGTYFQINALNGFFFFGFVFFVLFDRQERYPYWLKIAGLFSAILIFFLDVPSPDLAVWLMSLLIFDLFIKNYRQTDDKALLQITLLVFFTLLIKLTALMNLFLLLILWYKHRKVAVEILKPAGLFALVSLVFWMSKNYILTGYLFYPLDIFANVFHPQWQYPQDLLNYLGKLGKQETLAWSVSGLPDSFVRWLFNSNTAESFINPLMLILLLGFPVVVYLIRKTFSDYKAYLLIYTVGWVYFIILLFAGPNIRFFMPFLMFMALVLAEMLLPELLRKPVYWLSLILLLAGISMIIVVMTYEAKPLLRTLLINIKFTNSRMEYKLDHEGNLDYYSLDNEDFFWETGDAPLPATNYHMIEFFKKNFHYVPQRSETGFYMKLLE